MIAGLIDKLTRHEDLTSEEAAAAMAEVMDGRSAPAHIAGLLMGLAMKGERPAEIVGLARTMRANAVQLSRRHEDVFDTCGTGGDRSGTFNISSCAALVVAACGVRVAKHGNRSVSSLSGSADVFEALGVRVTAAPAVVERCLAEAGVGFFFAPTFHPSMRHAAQVRRDLGVRTAFNLLGPLTNPAGATRQIVGVPRPELTELLARSLMLLGSERAWVVHGADGIDEISTAGYTKISECRQGTVNTFYLHPADVGLPKASPSALLGGDAHENARIIRRILGGEHGAPRDVVLLNAGAGLMIGGQAPSVQEGIALRCGCDRQRRRGEDARPADRDVDRRACGGSPGVSADLLATIVASTRRIVDVRQEREPIDTLRDESRAARTASGPSVSRGAQSAGPLEHHRGVQEAVAVEGRPAAGVRSGGDREWLRGSGRGGDFRPDGVRRSSTGRSITCARFARPCRFPSSERTSSSRSTRCSKPGPPARTRSCSSSPH